MDYLSKEYLSDIKRVSVDADEIAKFSHEDDFTELEQVSLGLNRGDSQRLVNERVYPH